MNSETSNGSEAARTWQLSTQDGKRYFTTSPDSSESKLLWPLDVLEYLNDLEAELASLRQELSDSTSSADAEADLADERGETIKALREELVTLRAKAALARDMIEFLGSLSGTKIYQAGLTQWLAECKSRYEKESS